MAIRHGILTKGLQVGDALDTQGVYYAPYNKIKCTWKGEHALVAHVGSHKQFWGQQGHYIRSHFIVFQKVDEDGNGNWTVEKVWEKEVGRQFYKIKAEAIAFAETVEQMTANLAPGANGPAGWLGVGTALKSARRRTLTSE